ncbi:MAG: hypothetical protein JW889_02805 [Verrucomicrobia bacterium]|nr:hypothetical protein [Verrucomicrobiota bacterium]
MPTITAHISRPWLPWFICLVAISTTGAASETQQPAETVPARLLAWVLEPGEARGHTVEIELDTRLAITQGSEAMRRHTAIVASFQIESLGLRRRQIDEYVVEDCVHDFQLAVLTTADDTTTEVTMDRTGLTARQGRGQPHTAPWADVPRGHGGEIGELLGRGMTNTINRCGTALAVDARMKPWERVLDCMDLTPLLLPLVPLPDSAVELGTTWTVTGRRQVQLSWPWGSIELETRTEVKVRAFERQGDRDVVRLSFMAVTKPAEEQVRLRYALTLRGEVVLGLDGTVVGGEADITLAASTTVIDAVHELAGAGTLRFRGAPGAPIPPQNERNSD